MKQTTIVFRKSIFLCLFLLVCLPLAASSADGRAIYRISLGPNAVQGDHDSTIARISANGAVIAFASRATNLGGGANQTLKVYLYNQTTGAVQPYSSSGGDTYPTALSADGRYVVLSALSMYRSLQQDVAIYDRQSKTTVCASVGTDNACMHGGYEGSISGDGRYLAFTSSSPDLVSGDSNTCGNSYTASGRCPDIFLHDRDVSGSGALDQSGNIRTTRISVANGGAQANDESGHPVISANGRFVVFWSFASNLAPEDTDTSADVFLYNRDVSGYGVFDQPGNTHLSRISVSLDGLNSGGGYKGLDISADGRYIVFSVSGWYGHDCAYFTNYYDCTDVVSYDRLTGETTLVSYAYPGHQELANGWSVYPAISADGRYITYYSMAEANNIVPGDTNALQDVFLYDRQTGLNTLISTGISGEPAGGDSYSPAISTDGKSVVFTSNAANLVTSKTNGVFDVFVNGVPPQILFPRIYIPLVIK